jgi:uncharacterized membrane-anchored protein
MKKQIILLFTLLVAIFSSGIAVAAEKPITHISAVKQKGETILFSLSSSQPFIFANNRYVLYIGNKEFSLQEQSNEHGTGHISFFIQPGDFDKLQEGATMYLTYGAVDIENENMEELANNTRRCWSLGKFSKTLLTK